MSDAKNKTCKISQKKLSTEKERQQKSEYWQLWQGGSGGSNILAAAAAAALYPLLSVVNSINLLSSEEEYCPDPALSIKVKRERKQQTVLFSENSSIVSFLPRMQKGCLCTSKCLWVYGFGRLYTVHIWCIDVFEQMSLKTNDSIVCRLRKKNREREALTSYVL